MHIEKAPRARIRWCLIHRVHDVQIFFCIPEVFRQRVLPRLCDQYVNSAPQKQNIGGVKEPLVLFSPLQWQR